MAVENQERGAAMTPLPRAERPESADAARLLSALADLAARQRAAIVARDAAALGRLFEALVPLLAAVTAATGDDDRTRGARGEAAALGAVARRVRAQLRINQALIRNGLAAAAHFRLTLAGAGAGFFSEEA